MGDSVFKLYDHIKVMSSDNIDYLILILYEFDLGIGDGHNDITNFAKI